MLDDCLGDFVDVDVSYMVGWINGGLKFWVVQNVGFIGIFGVEFFGVCVFFYKVVR